MSHWKVVYINNGETTTIKKENFTLEKVVSYVSLELNINFTWIDCIIDLENKISYSQEAICLALANVYLSWIYPELEKDILPEISRLRWKDQFERENELRKNQSM